MKCLVTHGSDYVLTLSGPKGFEIHLWHIKKPKLLRSSSNEVGFIQKMQLLVNSTELCYDPRQTKTELPDQFEAINGLHANRVSRVCSRTRCVVLTVPRQQQGRESNCGATTGQSFLRNTQRVLQ